MFARCLSGEKRYSLARSTNFGYHDTEGTATRAAGLQRAAFVIFSSSCVWISPKIDKSHGYPRRNTMLHRFEPEAGTRRSANLHVSSHIHRSLCIRFRLLKRQNNNADQNGMRIFGEYRLLSQVRRIGRCNLSQVVKTFGSGRNHRPRRPAEGPGYQS